MKSIKVFWMGKPLREVYPHATKWQVLKWKIKEFFKKCIRIATWTGLTATILYTTFLAGAYFNPVVSYAIKEKLVTVESEIPVMDRIAGCESEGNPTTKGSMFGSNGQVRTNANKNGTTDVGMYQINNDVWGKKATELGYNIFTEEGNRAMAMWIYKNKGTGDWSASAKCWQK